jgi:hypothetical protein
MHMQKILVTLRLLLMPYEYIFFLLFALFHVPEGILFLSFFLMLKIECFFQGCSQRVIG